ncbi:MAG: hypothetical protein A2927_00060 [Candidatus Komeilibacteria bacterium RIFCSPLOWO2_01_FULL_45_10]|uniref:Rod shape-determining protein MreD n=1 Tax=Candidatus Komeilibacteria bacterium RIFCSPLOWO2_01_FULL_45_10 TaxID=1798550 RepID=A0A1G2BIJ6_9BACT|nr:MAG: hypothetical protein A2927_00060 [Candidatus Komeilibacteria bacterium RIFCSPLOWO2_01_FULL_45_10]
MKKTIIALIIIFAFISVIIRLVPHPANFAPIGALALFAGVYLPKKWSLILPITLMLISDIFVGFYDPRLMAVVYSCFLLTAVIGWSVKKNKNILTILTASLGMSVFFFLATNLAVWAFSEWYPHNFGGLMLSYYLAVPFFRNTLFGDLFFTAVFFGVYELIRLRLFKPIFTKEIKIRS